MARKTKKEPEEERGVPKADDEFTSMASLMDRGCRSRWRSGAGVQLEQPVWDHQDRVVIRDRVTEHDSPQRGPLMGV